MTPRERAIKSIKLLDTKVAYVLEKHEKNKTASGIYIPDSATDNFNNARIIAVGPDCTLQPGDAVIIPNDHLGNPVGTPIRIATVEPPLEFAVIAESQIPCAFHSGVLLSEN